MWLSLSQNEGGLDFMDYCTEDEAFIAFYMRPFDGDDDYPEDKPTELWCGAPYAFEFDELAEFYQEGYSSLNQAKWCKNCHCQR